LNKKYLFLIYSGQTTQSILQAINIIDYDAKKRFKRLEKIICENQAVSKFKLGD